MSVAVRIFSAQGDHPLMVDGTLQDAEAGSANLICGPDGSKLFAGSKVLISIENEPGKRTGTIRAVEPMGGDRFRLQFEDTQHHRAEQRDFPRLFAGLPIAYRIASAEEAEAWLAGTDVLDAWTEPDPYMNFSVGGLRFDTLVSLSPGTLLVIALRIGDDGPTWRTSARVVRVFDPSPDSDAVCSVAVSFEVIPDEAMDALSELTLQIQETMI